MRPKFKHIREKRFFASHPLYDAMNDICNPTGESCGVTVKHVGKTFKLDATVDTYFDATGKPQREVMVTNLDQPEEEWTVYKRNAEELANTPHEEIDQTNQPIIKRTLQDGKLSWLEKNIITSGAILSLWNKHIMVMAYLMSFLTGPTTPSFRNSPTITTSMAIGLFSICAQKTKWGQTSCLLERLNTKWSSVSFLVPSIRFTPLTIMWEKGWHFLPQFYQSRNHPSVCTR